MTLRAMLAPQPAAIEAASAQRGVSPAFSRRVLRRLHARLYARQPQSQALTILLQPLCAAATGYAVYSAALMVPGMASS